MSTKTTPGTLPHRGPHRHRKLQGLAEIRSVGLSTAILPACQLDAPARCDECDSSMPAGWWAAAIDGRKLCCSTCAEAYISEEYGLDEDDLDALEPDEEWERR